MTQSFNLSQLANNLNSSGQLDATDGLTNAVPIANGGTGASSVAAAVSNLSASIYPVGSIYINATVTTNPATLLGFGTWTAFGTGRVLVGLNTSDTAFDTLQETGGTKDATVVSHTHSISSQQVAGPAGSPINYVSTGTDNLYNTGVSTSPAANFSIDNTGSSGTNANLQPYITVCMWLRTA